MSCEACYKAYAPSAWDTEEDKERKKNGPPCGDCKPHILESNLIPCSVYSLCSDDINVASMGGAIGLRSEAIFIAMEMLNIHSEDREECFMKVKFLGKTIAGLTCQK